MIPISSNLSFENILNHYLDAGTDGNGWMTGDRSDIFV